MHNTRTMYIQIHVTQNNATKNKQTNKQIPKENIKSAHKAKQTMEDILQSNDYSVEKENK
jgi:hypothetical protein